MMDDWPDLLAALSIELDDCAAYVVIVTDRVTDEIDAYGPMAGAAAVREADQILREMQGEGLRDVSVRLIRLHAVGPPAQDGGDEDRTAFFHLLL